MDFSQLTNDQLIELLRVSLQEAARRGAATTAAAREICLDEDEKLRIETAAYKLELDRVLAAERVRVAKEAAEKARRDIEERRAAAGIPKEESADEQKARKIRERFEFEEQTLQQFKSLLGSVAGEEDWWIEVWSKNGDKRVYAGTVGVKFGKNEIDYYHTGKLSRHDQKKPGTIVFQKGLIADLAERDALAERLKPFFAALCEKFKWTVIGTKG